MLGHVILATEEREMVTSSCNLAVSVARGDRNKKTEMKKLVHGHAGSSGCCEKNITKKCDY